MSSNRSGAIHDLLARHENLADFIDALKTMDRSQQDPLGRSPLLHMEMILFVARAEKRRPELAKRLRARRKLIADIVETTSKNSGRNAALNPAWTGAIVLAHGGRLSPAPPDRSGDHAGRQFSARDRRSAAGDGNFVGLTEMRQAAAPCALCIWPATARTLRGDACQIANADSTLTAIPIAKAMV